MDDDDDGVYDIPDYDWYEDGEDEVWDPDDEYWDFDYEILEDFP